MGFQDLIIKLCTVLNPTKLFGGLYYYTVLPFFLANLFLLIYFISKNKEISRFIKVFFRKMPGYIRIILAVLIIVHLFFVFKIMNPINALEYPGFADIHQAQYLLQNGRMSVEANPYGFSIILAILHLVSRADYIWIMAAMTVIFSIIIIFLMMLLTFKITRSYYAIFFAPVLFLFSNKYLQLIPQDVSILASISTIILFVFISSFNIKKAILPAIFAVTLTPYFRMENLSFIFVFILLLMINRYWMGWRNAALLYVMFMPHFEYISKTKSITNTSYLIGPIGILSRVSHYPLQYGLFFGWLLIPLVIGLYQKRKHIILPLAAAGQLLTYILYEGNGTHTPERYFLNVLGLAVVLAGVGLFRIAKIAKKYYPFACAVLMVLLIFHMHPATARQQTQEIVTANEQASSLVNGTRYILYGGSIYVDAFGRFYNPSVTLYQDKGEVIDENYSDYDYVVYLIEGKVSGEDLNPDMNFTKINSSPLQSPLPNVFKIEMP